MNPYLAKLRALEAKRPPPADVGGFVSFVSAQSSPIPESASPQGGRAQDGPQLPTTVPPPTLKISNGGTCGNRQN